MPPTPRQPLMLTRVGRLSLQLEMHCRLQHPGAVRPWVQHEGGAYPMRRDDAAWVFSNTTRRRVFFCLVSAQHRAAQQLGGALHPAPSAREDGRMPRSCRFVLASHCAACPTAAVGVFLCVSAQRAAVLALGLSLRV